MHNKSKHEKMYWQPDLSIYKLVILYVNKGMFAYWFQVMPPVNITTKY